jgi:ribosomal protein S18 acetylase RimI-like enzyme
MVNEPVSIRPARIADADDAAVLIFSAYSHIASTYSPHPKTESGFTQMLNNFFQQDANRFSYQHTFVAQNEQQVVGLLLSFGGSDEPRLNEAVEQRFQQAPGGRGWHLTRESAEDEWYIDALAVYLQWEGHGIGSRLLEHAEKQALEHHYNKISLNVDKENERALQLYLHRGYVITGDTELYQRSYHRMVKHLRA